MSLLCTSRGFDLLSYLGKCNQLFTRIQITKQLAFLIISSIPYLKYVAQIPNHSLWSNQLIFTIFQQFAMYHTNIGCLNTICSKNSVECRYISMGQPNCIYQCR